MSSTIASVPPKITEPSLSDMSRPHYRNKNMNLMQLVAVGASNVQIRSNGTLQRNSGIRFSVEMICRIPLIVYHTAFIRILTAYTADRYTDQLPYIFNRHIRHIRLIFIYVVYLVYIRYTVYRIYTVGPALLMFISASFLAHVVGSPRQLFIFII